MKHHKNKAARRAKAAEDRLAYDYMDAGLDPPGTGSNKDYYEKRDAATAAAAPVPLVPTAVPTATATTSTAALPAPPAVVDHTRVHLKKKKKQSAIAAAGAAAAPKKGGTDLAALSFQLFTAHYGMVYAAEKRWTNALLPALCRPTTHVALINRYFVDLMAVAAAAMSHDNGDDDSSATDAKSTVASAGTNAAAKAIPALAETEIERQIIKRWNDASGATGADADTAGTAAAAGAAAGGGIRVKLIPGTAQNRCFLIDQSVASANAGALSFPTPLSFKSHFQHSNLLPYYLLDPSSVVTAEALNVQPNDRVLDLCCAPGGKALTILQSLSSRGFYQANELSLTRMKRLQSVLSSYLPPAILSRVSFTHFDATESRSFDTGRFDRVLVDAPCSSERHLLHNRDELMEWTASRTKQQAERQLLILMTAFKCLKPGGRLVYATCSLSPLENDGVIQKLLAKVTKLAAAAAGGGTGSASPPSTLRIVQHFGWGCPAKWTIGRQTTYGWSMLPDDTIQVTTPAAPATAAANDSDQKSAPAAATTSVLGGFGPMYVCVMQKTGGVDSATRTIAAGAEVATDEKSSPTVAAPAPSAAVAKS